MTITTSEWNALDPEQRQAVLQRPAVADDARVREGTVAIIIETRRTKHVLSAAGARETYAGKAVIEWHRIFADERRIGVVCMAGQARGYASRIVNPAQA